MSKTEVYSWRVSPETKAALEEEARREGLTLAALLQQQEYFLAAAECYGRLGQLCRAHGLKYVARPALRELARQYLGALAVGSDDRPPDDGANGQGGQD